MKQNKTESAPLYLYGRRINNTVDLIKAEMAVRDDVRAGKLSSAKAEALRRQSNAIFKAILSPAAALWLRRQNGGEAA